MATTGNWHVASVKKREAAWVDGSLKGSGMVDGPHLRKRDWHRVVVTVVWFIYL